MMLMQMGEPFPSSLNCVEMWRRLCDMSMRLALVASDAEAMARVSATKACREYRQLLFRQQLLVTIRHILQSPEALPGATPSQK